MRKALGLTLIELLVTLAITAILMTLAAPSFKRMLQSNNMSSAVNTFMSDARFARSEAVRTGGPIVMCRSDAPEAATPACASDGTTTKGWASGWIIFHDKNSDGAWDANDQTLRVQAALSSIDSILEGTANKATKFRFTATGRLYEAALKAELKFGGSDFDTKLQRKVCMSAGGRARIAATTDTGPGTCGEV